MKGRRIPLPAAGVLALGTTGCNRAIVGDWICVEYGGEDMPYVESDSDGGYTYRYEYGISMVVWPDLYGQIRVSYELSYTGPDGRAEASYGYVYGFEVVPEGGRRYTIELMGNEGELDCELSGGELDCEIEDDTDIVFERDKGD